MRELAELALLFFPLSNPRLHFIHHGENTTFRMESRGKRYLLRVHRAGYHTPEAILEELAWLRSLAGKKTLRVPKPVRSRRGRWLELVKSEKIPGGRYCDLLEWVPGTFARSTVGPATIFRLGALIARLQNHTGARAVKHRRYWDARGLVGPSGKFGAIDKLDSVSPRQQKLITAARKIVFRKLRAFEKKFPRRQGLIHADLHFGNFVVQGKELGAIDFDDSGFGFHAYDLAIPLTHLENICLNGKKKDPARLRHLTEVIQQGYASERPWDDHDRAILPYLVTARRLLMLGWLNSRRDNPKFREILPGAVKRTIRHLNRNRVLQRG